TQGLRISLWTIAPASVAVGLAFLGLGFVVLRATKAPVRSGREAMVGEAGQVLSDFRDKEGQIRVAGAIWRAVTKGDGEPLKRGEEVEVREVQGLTLLVDRKQR